jgi:hypothetical protein
MAIDPFTPDQDDKNLIINDVVVLKNNEHGTLVTGLHKWKDIWDNDLHFKARIPSAATTFLTYRAIAITIPVFYSIADNLSTHPYIGYVVGVNIEQGKQGRTQVYPMNEIQWE